MHILDINSEEDLIVYLLREPYVNNMRELANLLFSMWKIGKADIVSIEAEEEWQNICKVTFECEHRIMYKMISGEVRILQGAQSVGFIKGSRKYNEMISERLS
jgi:hypothetical protein